MLMADCASSSLLSADGERTLVDAARAGDESARDRLTRSNVPLVISIARRFHHAGRDLGDIVGYGLVGLAAAVDQFDPMRGTRFGTYAYRRILVEIMRGVALDDTWPIRLPVRHAQAFMRLRQSWSVSGLVSAPASKRWADAFRAACAAVQSFGISDAEWEDGQSGPEWEAILREQIEAMPVQFIIAVYPLPDASLAPNGDGHHPSIAATGPKRYIAATGGVETVGHPATARKFATVADLMCFMAGRGMLAPDEDPTNPRGAYRIEEYRGDGVTIPMEADHA